MKKILLYFSLFYSCSCFAQYKGGTDDGAAKANTTNQNSLPNIYLGGSNDGFGKANIINQNTLPNIYLGGNNDGFSKATITNQNVLPNIYAGGSNDGFSKASVLAQNTLPEIYRGGTNDGFAKATITNQNLLPNIYAGGTNDGFSSKNAYGQNPLCGGDNVRWNGSVSTAWDNPLNWDCLVMPNINSIVTIPSGLTNYPTVSFSYEIKTMYLQTGTTFILKPGVYFKLNGQ